MRKPCIECGSENFDTEAEALEHERGQKARQEAAHVEYTEAQRQLAEMARQKAMGRDVLYHGTGFAKSILKMGILFHADTGSEHMVSFTRSPEVAAYWALKDHDYKSDRESVLIFDRQSLERQYSIESVPGVWQLSRARFHDEQEEAIWANVIGIDDHLLGLVSGPAVRRSRKCKTLNRKYMAVFEARLWVLALEGYSREVDLKYGPFSREAEKVRSRVRATKGVYRDRWVTHQFEFMAMVQARLQGRLRRAVLKHGDSSPEASCVRAIMHKVRDPQAIGIGAAASRTARP